jgi:2-polyprenyl-3-methyl-5-hydroxy-6-metoxy-1,4-benzoquinol methylase
MPADLPVNFRPDAFAGTVDDYVRYRPPYDARVVREILSRAALPAEGARLIDLACGPGRLTFDVAEHFAEGLAIDLEPKMIAAARLEAERRGVRHIHWSLGRAEDLEAPAGAFDLVTAASAFHRFDQPRVAALAYRWLKPGGALVTVGEVPAGGEPAKWRQAITDLVHAYVGEPVQRLQGAPKPTPGEGLAHEEQVLRHAGFTPVESRSFEAPYTWTLESLLGYLRSTSFASRAALGERHVAFEADLTALLLAFEGSGRYPEIIANGYTIARKPSSGGGEEDGPHRDAGAVTPRRSG